jgi:hypothetical protein
MKLHTIIFCMMFLGMVIPCAALKDAIVTEFYIYDPATGEDLGGPFRQGSNSPIELLPGQRVCFRTTIENVGDENITDGTYSVQHYVFDSENQYGRGITTASKTGVITVKPDETEVIIGGCSTVKTTATPDIYYIRSRVYDRIVSAPFPSGWPRFNDVINIEPHEGYINFRLPAPDIEFTPSAAYSGSNILLVHAPITLTLGFQLQNRAGSAPFSGTLDCRGTDTGYGYYTWDFDIASGETLEHDVFYDESFFTLDRAGFRGSFGCRVTTRQAGTTITLHSWTFWPYYVLDNVGIVQINSFRTESASYDTNDSGVLSLTLARNRMDYAEGSTARVRLLANSQEILSDDFGFELRPGATRFDKSWSFTIPESLPFVDTLEYCFGNVNGISPSGPYAYSVIKLVQGLGETTSPPGEVCRTARASIAARATCGPISESEHVSRQICTCSNEYCSIDASGDYIIIGAAYSPQPGRSHQIIDGNARALFRNLNTGPDREITITYIESGTLGSITSSSLDLSFAFLLLFGLCALIFRRLSE